ncbi:MAG: carboxypeptidase regulatory-like domain-containing protein [Gemmatimonadales bacterium]|nr:MAG: carboxypeptidase regulatory-like domain-containing protein [Gemmatimonadales bacterium]
MTMRLPCPCSRRVPFVRMRRGIRRGLGLVAASFLLAIATAACDAGAPEEPGTILGQVTGEGGALVGVVVELTGPVNRVLETDAQGRYRFESVPTGAYVVSVRNLPLDAAFPAVSRSASVTSGSSVVVDFQGNFIRTASISGTVLARDRGVSGVTVTLSGPDASTVQTGSDGTFTFPSLRAGSYQAEISGFSSSLNFASTRSSVELQPGQSHTMRFDGDPELTASLVIRSVERVLPGGAREPADLRALSGLVEIRVTLDRGVDRVDSVTVSLGSTVVGKQVFEEPSMPEGVEAAVLPLDLLFPVRTDAFDAQTGVPLHPNGEKLLTVRLGSREGGPAAWTASVQVRLANRNTFATTLLPSRGPVADPSGNAWIGGALDVRVLPVLFDPGKQVTSVTLELRDSQGGLIARSAAGGTAPLLVRFPTGTGEPASISGYVTPPSTTDRLRVVQARYADGSLVPDLPIQTADTLRIDQVAPDAEAFQLPRQGSASRCCLENWVGSDFAFAGAVLGLSDPGVGGITARVHAGAATLTDAQLLALAPVTTGGQLAQTASNTAYRAVVVLEDALGNTRVRPLMPSPGNPLMGANGAVFGVDRTPPVATLATGGGTLPARSVNPPEESAWGFGVDDSVSGVGPSPLVATIRRFGPTDPPAGTCLFPSGNSDCSAEPSGLLRPVPPGTGEGYLRIRASGVDRSGNLSAPVEAWVLRDLAAPQVSSLFLGSSPMGGAEVSVILSATDNIDLFRARILTGFTEVDGSGGTLSLAAPVGIQSVGEPFGGDPVREASVQFRFPFVHGLQRAGSGAAGEAAGGPLFRAGTFRASVEDAAGNVGTRQLLLPPPPQGAMRGFDAAARGADEAVTVWRVTADRTVVCRAASESCPAGTSGPVQLTALAQGSGGSFPNPFVRVHFLTTGDDARWIGTATQGTAAGEGGRVWELSWTPGTTFDAGLVPVRALGVDADGNGLLTTVLLELEFRE